MRRLLSVQTTKPHYSLEIPQRSPEALITISQEIGVGVFLGD